MDTYLIWSNEHRRWWRGGGAGYTSRVDDAGLFSRSEAIEISTRALLGRRGVEPLPELPVRRDDMREMLVDKFAASFPGHDPEPPADADDQPPGDFHEIWWIYSGLQEQWAGLRIAHFRKTSNRDLIVVIQGEPPERAGIRVWDDIKDREGWRKVEQIGVPKVPLG